jgi:hypothetical protein
MSNTHPNTPFGLFFDKIGIWHPSLHDTIEAAYNKLKEVEKIAVKDASGYIAIINANLDKAPDFVYEIIQQKFPEVTKEAVAAFVNNVNVQILKVDANTPDDFEGALSKLQAYLSKYEGNTWIALTRAVVSVGADFLSGGVTPIVAIETVLEYVYRNFVKPKVEA